MSPSSDPSVDGLADTGRWYWFNLGGGGWRGGGRTWIRRTPLTTLHSLLCTHSSALTPLHSLLCTHSFPLTTLHSLLCTHSYALTPLHSLLSLRTPPSSYFSSFSPFIVYIFSTYILFTAVFRIRDISFWHVSGSGSLDPYTLIYGSGPASGSCSFCQWLPRFQQKKVVFFQLVLPFNCCRYIYINLQKLEVIKKSLCREGFLFLPCNN